MKQILLMFAILFAIPFIALSQQGSNAVQISAQAAIPTGELADVVKLGFGGVAKGIYGISNKPQALTIEVGYNRFAVKGLPSGVSAHYSAVPVYAGYRANLSGVVLESQAGISFNHIAGSGSGSSASASQTAFGWSLSAGYQYKSFEFGIRYQSSEGSEDTTPIRFVGIRLGYNFSL